MSRRHLLQWKASAQVESDLARGDPQALSLAWPLASLALGLALVLLAGAPWPITAALCLLWGGTPYWLVLGGRPARRAESPLGEAERAELLELAEATWRYFDSQVGPSTHHLPPDNVQTLPRTVVATRTSPTNIGLYLMAIACARSFGWLQDAEALARGQRPVVEDMPKVRAAALAAHLHAHHAVARVDQPLHARLLDGGGEAWPAAAGVELRAGLEERFAAAHAAVAPGLEVVPPAAGEGALGGRVARHLVLQGVELGAPLLVALAHLVARVVVGVGCRVGGAGAAQGIHGRQG